MVTENFPQSENSIARCRLFLSLIAMVAVFVDPTKPFFSHWVPLTSGRFTIDPYVLVVMGTHLLYSLVVYWGIRGEWFSIPHLTIWTQVADVGLGAAIALMTEGATSPFYPFFAFAVLVAGSRSGLRQAMLVTTASVVLYLGMIALSAPGNTNHYIMRPAYLAITGYLVGYVGQQRLDLQDTIRQLEAAAQRQRIARDLHDGFVQALAGINLRIEGCRRFLRQKDAAAVLDELNELESSVNREYDDVRAYMRSLAGIHPSQSMNGSAASTRVALDIQMNGSIDLVEHVLQIAREGISNVRRHAVASSARINISLHDSQIRIHIEDDGIGLQRHSAPWSIVSRVKELGGQIQVLDEQAPGAHLAILLPQC